ncbi:DUF349 domain-containing protein, partial [bacterium AH-315-A23]|nr:DUF349 domain-containing protein [bacterium AH-315-A23]
MLDEIKKLPNVEEEINLTPQNSEVPEEKKSPNLIQEEISSVDEVTDEGGNDEISIEDSKSTSKSSEDKETDTVTEKSTPVTNKAIDEIESKIAESSEKIEHEAVEMLDYGTLSLEDLVAELSKLVKENPVQSIHNNVNNIKNAFNVKFGELLKNEKTKFLEEGGNIIDFQYTNPCKSNYNSILYDYKVKKNEFYAKQDSQLNDNFENKLALIEELKHLIDHADGSTMYKVFKGIQERWRVIGPIPRAKYNDTWRTYHHHVERFYDLLHLSNDLRDLDFKHNYEEKLALVLKAEELAELEDINLAFNELQILHK